jgi:hypothetical protein
VAKSPDSRHYLPWVVGAVGLIALVVGLIAFGR